MLYSREPKDPNATVGIELDWAPELGAATIASSNWIVPSGITMTASSFTSTTTAVGLTGGTLGQTYRLTNRVTFQGGGGEDWVVDVPVEEMVSFPVSGPPYATVSEALLYHEQAEGSPPFRIEAMLRQAARAVARYAPKPKDITGALTASMNATQTTVPVPKIEDFASSGIVRIDSELIQYEAKETSTSSVTGLYSGPGNLTGAVRGRYATVPASHALGAIATDAEYPLLARDAELAVFSWVFDTGGGYKPSRTGVVGSESYTIEPAQLKEMVRQIMGRYYTGGGKIQSVAVGSTLRRLRPSRPWIANA